MKKYNAWLGYEQLNVSAGGIVHIVRRPQVPFRGHRLVIPQHYAENFVIISMRVAQQYVQPISSDALPAECFTTRLDRLAAIDKLFLKDGVYEIKINQGAAEMIGEEFELPIAQVACDMTLTVQNVGPYQADFRAGLLGEVPHF